MARIPQAFIDQLLDHTDIVALIGGRVALKRAGAEYAACCPFHDEKTPSFTVAPNKQFYHCFGCGAHGSAISFLMDYDRLTFRDAVETLADEAGLTLPAATADAEPDGPPVEPLYEVLTQADRYYRKQLRQASPVIDYLKRRGVSGQAAQRFGLGFAPDHSRTLTAKISDTASAARAGLLIERDHGGYFDRFRNRLMFPIRDTRGRTIAFGGRAMGDDRAKYLNSPETPLFHKSNQLYGLFEARQALRDIPRLLVVEGYMDVIALAEAGFTNAVATLGTATTEDHLKLLFRHTEEVVFCFDGDDAGQRAARKALDRCMPVLRGSRRVRFLFLPSNEDPDSLVRSDNGTERMQAAIEAARPASQVLLEQLTDNVDLHSAEGSAQLIERARGYCNALPPDGFRDALIGEVAALAGQPTDAVRAHYAKATPSARTATDDDRDAPQRGQIKTPALSRALTLLLNDPSLAADIADTEALRNATTRGTEVLADAIDFFAANPTLTTAHWLERQRNNGFFKRLQALAAQETAGKREARGHEFMDHVKHLKTQGAAGEALRQRYRELLSRQAKTPLDTSQAAELNELHRRINARNG